MKNILIIAGSDSVGGAGIQADLKTCEALKCYGSTAITAITAQNTNGVSNVMAVSAEILDAQIKMITDELEIHAIKIGMLFNEKLIKIVKFWLEKINNIPVVIDPVCVAKSGAKLLENEALNALKEILPLASIITPNIQEAELLKIDLQNLPCDTLIKRTKVDTKCQDTLYKKDGTTLNFAQPLLKPEIMHGAGCTLSTAIACHLANDNDTQNAVANAKKYVSNVIQNALKTKYGIRLLDHKKA